MSIVRINELPEANNATSDDLLIIMDDPSASAITKKVSIDIFKNNEIDWTLIINSDNSISTYDLTTISSNQFENNAGIALRIGNVITIGSYAFRYCSGFTGDLSIPNSVTSIGSDAFYGCSSFNGNLTIGNSVTTIGSYAFHSCSGFNGNLTIGSSVTTIGSYAFYNCSGFNGNLTIGNSVTSIESYAFYNCSGLTNVNCYAPLSVFPNDSEFASCSFTTFHVRSSDSSWTAGSTTLGGHTFTVIKDLT